MRVQSYDNNEDELLGVGVGGGGGTGVQLLLPPSSNIGLGVTLGSGVGSSGMFSGQPTSNAWQTPRESQPCSVPGAGLSMCILIGSPPKSDTKKTSTKTEGWVMSMSRIQPESCHPSSACHDANKRPPISCTTKLPGWAMSPLISKLMRKQAFKRGIFVGVGVGGLNVMVASGSGIILTVAVGSGVDVVVT